MATINAGNLSLLDLTSRMDPNGAIAPIVESLTKQNVVLKDAIFREGNLATGHTFVSRTALPSVAYRQFNQGVATSKSRTAPVTETCGMLEGNSKVDVDLAKLNGNEAAFRLSEDVAFVQAMNNQCESSFFYDSTLTNPERPMGLAPRLASSSNPYWSQVVPSVTAQSGADQSSIWLVGWGDNTVYGIVPKGQPGGLTRRDLGQQLTRDDGGTNEFLAYVTNWNWKFGWCVQDARYLSRTQLDMSALAATGNLIFQAMIRMVNKLFSLDNCKPVFYCGRDVYTFLELQALDSVKSGGGLTFQNVGGQPVMMFRGIPVRRTDALLITESAIS